MLGEIGCVVFICVCVCVCVCCMCVVIHMYLYAHALVLKHTQGRRGGGAHGHSNKSNGDFRRMSTSDVEDHYLGDSDGVCVYGVFCGGVGVLCGVQ